YLTWGGSRFEAGILAFIALLVVVGAPLQYRRARLQRAFGHNPLDLPGRLEEIGDSQRRELFGWSTLLHSLDRDPVSLAADMRNLRENLVSRRPGALSWLLLLGLYLAGFAVAFQALWLSFHDTQEQRRVLGEALIDRFDRATAEIDALRIDAARRRVGELRGEV